MRKLALLTAVSVALMATNTYAQSAGAAQDAQAVQALNQAYGEALGVSAEQAVAYQAQVARALQMDQELRTQRPDYVGLRIAPGGTFRATFSFTGSPAGAIPTLAGFEARQVSHSAQAIQQALNTVARAVPTSLPYTLYFDDTVQRIKLHVRPGAAIPAVVAALAIAIPIDVVEDNLIVQTTADLEGGRQVIANNEICSSGFSVVHTDGRRGITTAGHCPNAPVTFEGRTVPIVQELYGTTNSRDVQWHTNTTDVFTPYVWVGSGYLLVQQVTALAAGVPVCLQGSVNINRCARVYAINVSGRDNNNVYFANAVSFKRDDNSYVVSKGDSGGAMVTAPNSTGTAHGVEFGGSDETSVGSGNFRTGYYVKASDFSLMGVSIMTRPPY